METVLIRVWLCILNVICMAAIIAVVVVGAYGLFRTNRRRENIWDKWERAVLMLFASLQGVGIVSDHSYVVRAIKLESERK